VKRRNWAAIAVDWYEDPVVQAAADECREVLWIWPVLIAMAKRKSDAVDNPDGVVKISSRQLAYIGGVDVESVERALRAMQEGELLTVEQHKAKKAFSITLAKFADWQHATGSNADRQRQKRFAGKNASTVTTSTQVVTTPTQHDTKCHYTTQHNTTLDGISPPSPPPWEAATRTLAAHLGQQEEEWIDRIGMWWSGNRHISEGDLVAALLAITARPDKPRNPFMMFQRIVKNEAGRTRQTEAQISAAAAKPPEPNPVENMTWQERWIHADNIAKEKIRKQQEAQGKQ
jgi:hypothetical protein